MANTGNSTNNTMQNVGRVTNNATIASVIGAIMTGIIGLITGGLVTSTVVYHDAILFSDISHFVKSLFVDPGYVSEEILAEESPYAQLEMISDSLSVSIETNAELNDAIRSFLVDVGESEVTVRKLNSSQLISELGKQVGILQKIRDDNSTLSENLKDLQSQVLAQLSTPDAYISGEMLDTTLQNYLATVNKHHYYSEDFLNIFLPEKISYEVDTIYYHKDAPERINVVDNASSLIFDRNGLELYDGSTHFTMGKNDYYNGVQVMNNRLDQQMFIASKKSYSSITFTLGHIDDWDRGGREVIIYYMDNNGEYKEAGTFALYAEMPIKEYTVDIHHTQNVKIAITGQYGSYAIANIYLVR